MPRIYFLLALLVNFILISSRAEGANKTFTGPGNFSDATRWSGGTLPGAGDDLTIDGICTFDDNRGLIFDRLNLGNPNPYGTLQWPVGGTANFIVNRIQMNNNASRINMTNGGTLTVNTQWNMGGSAALIPGIGTVVINTASMTLPAQLTSFYNLRIQKAGSIITLSGTTVVSGTLTIAAGTLDVSASNFALSIGRDFSNSGTFTQRAGTVTLNGSVSQTISGSTTTTFNNLTVNSFGVNLIRSINVNGALNFIAGRINTAANSVTMGAAGSVTGASAGRYVNGILTKPVTVGTNIARTFEIGNNSTYNPVSLTFANITTAGTLTARERSGDHPSIASSCIDAAKSVNFYWSLSSSGFAFSNYSATFNFTSADYDAAGNPILFGVQNFSAAWTIPATSSRTATSVTANTMTTLGDFAAGESETPASVTVSANPGTSVCPGTSVTFTASPVNGGASPTYQWLKNGVAVGTGLSYTDPALNANDSIRCLITSNAPCVFIRVVSSTQNIITPIIGVWRGVTNTNWNTPTNWCGNVLPASTDNIVINSGVPNMPMLNGPVTCNNLLLSALTTLTLNGNSFTINGNLNGTGSFVGSSTSSLIVNGSGSGASIQLAQTSTSTRTLQNLTVNRSLATVTLADSVLITGTLTLSNGNIATNDKLKLVSSATATARIGTITGGGTISGKVTMERYLPGGTGWHLLSSSVTGCTLSDWEDDFIMGGFPGSQYPTVTNSSILTYNESTAGIYDSGYVAPSGITNAITANKGYWAYIINTPLKIDVTGNLIQGNQPVSLSYTNNNASTEIGWNLIANPYPSAIDWDNSNLTRTNMDGAVYLFNGTSEQYSTYVGGIGINGGSQYIPSSQGMLVQATGPGASITFRETCKSNQDPSFMRLQTANPAYDLMRLSVSGTSGRDETVIRFTSGGTNSYDNGLDATKLFNWDASSPMISTVLAQDYSINSLPQITQGKIIPLRIVAMTSGIYTIKLDQHYQMPSTSCIMLEDLYTGIFKNFNTDSTYTCWLSDTTWSPRFRIHIGQPVTFDIRNELCQDGSIIADLPSSTACQVTWKDPGNSIIRQVTATGADTLTNLTGGTYQFTVSGSGQCPALTQTILLESDSLFVNASIIDPSCNSIHDGEINLTTTPGANFSVTVTNGNTTAYSGSMNNSLSLQGLAGGNYTIVYSNNCVNDSTLLTLIPQENVSAAFSSSNDTVNVNGTVSFTNLSLGANSYDWDFGDGSHDNLQNPIHSYSVPGVYQVTLISYNGICSDTLVKYIIVSPLSNSDLALQGTRIFVKDNYHTLVLSSEKMLEIGSSITVHDVTGKLITQNLFSGNSAEIHLPDLSPGIYSVQVSSTGKVLASRFVIPQ